MKNISLFHKKYHHFHDGIFHQLFNSCTKVNKKKNTNNYSKRLIKIIPSSKLLNNSDQNYDGKTLQVYGKK